MLYILEVCIYKILREKKGAHGAARSHGVVRHQTIRALATWKEERGERQRPTREPLTLREMELTMLFPCTHLSPASTIGNLDESIMNGTCDR